VQTAIKVAYYAYIVGSLILSPEERKQLPNDFLFLAALYADVTS